MSDSSSKTGQKHVAIVIKAPRRKVKPRLVTIDVPVPNNLEDVPRPARSRNHLDEFAKQEADLRRNNPQVIKS
jgi:hypothetical protein